MKWPGKVLVPCPAFPDRIFLRVLTPDDGSERYASWLGDQDTSHFLETRTAPSLQDLRSYIEQKAVSDNALLFGIFDVLDGHIGNVKLEPINETTATLGILIGESAYRGRSLGTCVTSTIAKFAHEELSVPCVNLGVVRSHASAIRAYEKAGFVAARINSLEQQNTDQLMMENWNNYQWSLLPLSFVHFDGDILVPLTLFEGSSCFRYACIRSARGDVFLVASGELTPSVCQQLRTIALSFNPPAKALVGSDNLTVLSRIRAGGFSVSFISRADGLIPLHVAFLPTYAWLVIVEPCEEAQIGLSKFVLGTAQLGLLSYGIANAQMGVMDEDVALHIVESAILCGVGAVDTARAYGLAEHRVGKAFSALSERFPTIPLPQLVSKVAPPAPGEQMSIQKVSESLSETVQALRIGDRNHASGVVMLLHRWEMRHHKDGTVWDVLRSSLPSFSSYGASLQSPAELIEAAQDDSVTHVQIPFNLLDWRWRASNVQQAIKGMIERHVVIHARSALLQGALTLRPSSLWPTVTTADSKCVSDVCAILDAAVVRYGRLNTVDLCFAYVRGQKWIDGVVVGVDSASMLLENLALFSREPLSYEQCQELDQLLPHPSEDVLDPARWPKK